MRVATSESRGAWADVPVDGDEGIVVAALEALLLSDRLALLAGLGTSLCIKNEHGGVAATTMAGLWESVREADPDGLNQALTRVGVGNADHNIELFLSRCQASLQLDPEDGLRAFVANAERSIAAACNFVTSIDQVTLHTSFLRKLARRPPGADRFRLFTSNYDLAFEFAASAAGLISLDGFSHSMPRLFDPAQFDHDLVRRRSPDGSDIEFLTGVHYLYKLHGSIDWRRTSDGVTKTALPDGTGSDQPCLIFPRDNKFQLSYEPPFFDLLAAFQAVLRSDNLGLFVAGFGFADLHIVRPILSALRGNGSLSAVFVDPRLETDPPPEFSPVLRLVEQGDPRITLIAGTFEDVVPMIPNLQPDTHLEAHAHRVGTAGLQ